MFYRKCNTADSEHTHLAIFKKRSNEKIEQQMGEFTLLR